MRTGTAQFFYCCPENFAKQFKIVSKSIKKQKGQLLTLTEEPDVKPGWVSHPAKQWGLHPKCFKSNSSCSSRCTITYEVPDV